VKEQALRNGAHARSASPLADYIELAKPRITLLVVVTAAVGYFMASRAGLSVWGLIHTMIGTALVAGGASTLNQVMERDADARMRRTANRAVPAGRVSPESAFAYGTALGVGGVLYIALFLNPLTTILAAATFASYTFLYTPMKRRTTLNTMIGAVPGALPPLGGWTAAGGDVTPAAGALFLIVFLWQVPHFLAIAWLLRDDYERGGFRMLPVVDPSGASTGRHIALSALALVPVSLTPTLLGLTGSVYFFGALALTLALAAQGLWMARRPTDARARRLFLGSIIYLPALLVVMMIDKLPA
jgi:protoheme IX farnesyltransferase